MKTLRGESRIAAVEFANGEHQVHPTSCARRIAQNAAIVAIVARIDDDGSEHSGQPDVGWVAMRAMTRPFSVTWICSMSIPSGRESKECPFHHDLFLGDETCF